MRQISEWKKVPWAEVALIPSNDLTKGRKKKELENKEKPNNKLYIIISIAKDFAVRDGKYSENFLHLHCCNYTISYDQHIDEVEREDFFYTLRSYQFQTSIPMI